MIAPVLTAAAVVIGTWGFGWLAVPAIGLAVGLARISERPIRTAAFAGFIGWAALLLIAAVDGPVGDLAGVLGGVMGVPAIVVISATLLYPTVLAGAAAGVGTALRSFGQGGRAGDDEPIR
jgi:hypothetical protein